MDFRERSVQEWAAAVQDREVSAREMVEASLAAIEAQEELNAFVATDPERSLAEADEIDARLASGDDVGPLAGIPFGVKDLEDAAGYVTTQGSFLHADDPPAEADSILVERLRAQGCVVMGKTNTPEFGWTGDTYNPVFGATGNPWNPKRSPGGSSGGTASAADGRTGATVYRLGRGRVDPHSRRGLRVQRFQGQPGSGAGGRHLPAVAPLSPRAYGAASGRHRLRARPGDGALAPRPRLAAPTPPVMASGVG